MVPLHRTVEEITDRVRARSLSSRSAYLARLEHAVRVGPVRGSLSCTNLAHAFAAAPSNDKLMLRALHRPNLAIVSAYNDMLSAHQPLGDYPALIKQAANEVGATAQFAGGVPAMCDGITQGQPGMELSLFSRDTIALSTAVALSHNSFDAAVYLGVCDKIVPGLLIGALSFGHLPAVFVPAGPMTTGMSNDEKARARQLFAEGKIDRDVLLEAECRSYHSAGTCTFYGTANSNQVLMEVMGLHVAGSAFVNPGTPLRDALTRAAAVQALKNTALGERFVPVGRMIDERSLVNAIIALLATGGSTNHTMHLVAIAHAAGIQVNWDDFHDLSAVIPLLTRIYPNGKADVNQFHAAGGVAFLIRELLDAGLLHADAQTITGTLADSTCEPWLNEGRLEWRAAAEQSGDAEILRPAREPFEASGGLRVLEGNLGRAVIKVSAIKPEHRVVEAPALVFNDQDEVTAAFERGELERDFIAVIRYQGPRANGMPELHNLTPPLSVLQGRGYKVALVTDGRMSGASGKVPAAIHVTPEAVNDGPLGRVRDGDTIRLDGETGELNVLVDAAEWAARTPESIEISHAHWGMGRELFDGFRMRSSGAEQGALSILCDLFDTHFTPSGSCNTQVQIMSTTDNRAEPMALPQILGLAPVLPVIVIEELAHAVPLARALVAGGLRVLEVTLRTPVALQAVSEIAAAVPDAVVGVGTLTHPRQFVEAEAAGARFAVSPGLTPALLAASKASAIPLLPGVFTPGEAMRAYDEGFRYLKLFPARQAGGLGMLQALGGPLPELQFCPTGGISNADFREYLALPNVVCVGGSWVAPLKLMQAGDWQSITRLASEASA